MHLDASCLKMHLCALMLMLIGCFFISKNWQAFQVRRDNGQCKEQENPFGKPAMNRKLGRRLFRWWAWYPRVPEFKSCSAVEVTPGGVDSACHPSEVGKMSTSLLGWLSHSSILCRSGAQSRIAPNSPGDCFGSTDAMYRVWPPWMEWMSGTRAVSYVWVLFSSVAAAVQEAVLVHKPLFCLLISLTFWCLFQSNNNKKKNIFRDIKYQDVHIRTVPYFERYPYLFVPCIVSTIITPMFI